MPTGIPQGSNLATLLFIVYINDIKYFVKDSKILLFIDDLKIFIELKNNSCINLIQNDLNNVCLWAKQNGFVFNILKSYAMLYSKVKADSHSIYISNSLIPNTDEIKDLGIIFQNNLKFNKHIDSIIFKAKRKINFIKFYCKRFTNVNLIIKIYNSIVKSNLMYGSTLWNPNNIGTITSLEKVQLLFLRFLSYKTDKPMSYIDHNYDPIMNFTKITSLELSGALNDLKFFFKLINNITKSPELLTKIKFYSPVNPIRNPTLIFLVDNKLLIYSIIQRICYLANLNKNWIKIKELSLYQFIKLIKDNEVILKLPIQKI